MGLRLFCCILDNFDHLLPLVLLVPFVFVDLSPGESGTRVLSVGILVVVVVVVAVVLVVVLCSSFAAFESHSPSSLSLAVLAVLAVSVVVL